MREVVGVLDIVWGEGHSKGRDLLREDFAKFGQ